MWAQNQNSFFILVTYGREKEIKQNNNQLYDATAFLFIGKQEICWPLDKRTDRSFAIENNNTVTTSCHTNKCNAIFTLDWHKYGCDWDNDTCSKYQRPKFAIIKKHPNAGRQNKSNPSRTAQ